MDRFRHCLWLLVFSCCIAALASGCGGGDPPKKKEDTRSKVEYFRDTQGPTMTPHGKIKMDSVEEKNGKIQYQTEDSKKWRVDMTKQADGTYRYGTPDEVK